MTTTRIERDGAFHFHVVGEMTFSTTTMLLQQSETFFSGSQDVEIDLSQVTAADSAGLALLLEWKAVAAHKGVQVAVKEIPGDMLSIAHLCQIDSLFEDSETGG
ncbi:MAG: STAS domain-containing protein [Candidatus Thiodiazotropha sp. (ex Monitilora ramsayi)]|nr:STAS domain-containing protein [Candidatus Thiodiazotropha sp. (ex Monitilora ramsayi)]